MCGQHAVDLGLFIFLSFPPAGMGKHVRYLEISHMDKNNGYPDLVCENRSVCATVQSDQSPP